MIKSCNMHYRAMLERLRDVDVGLARNAAQPQFAFAFEFRGVNDRHSANQAPNGSVFCVNVPES